jgi:hypothetical protein
MGGGVLEGACNFFCLQSGLYKEHGLQTAGSAPVQVPVTTTRGNGFVAYICMIL